jgi:preprotein translocase subunit SecE
MKIKEYFKSVIAESKAIVWPSKKKVYQDTVIVIVALVVSGAFIAVVDYGLTQLLKYAILSSG